MKRQLPWVLMAGCLCASCASYPVSETQVLASDIANERPRNVICEAGDVRYCEVGADGEAQCGCVDFHAIARPPY